MSRRSQGSRADLYRLWEPDERVTDLTVRSGLPRVLVWVRAWSTARTLLFSVLWLAGAIAADWFSGDAVTTIALFGLHVAVVAWAAGFSWGLFAAITGAAASTAISFIDQATTGVSTATIIVNATSKSVTLALIVVLISRLAALVNGLERYALVDALTSLPNRRATLDIADREFARARRDRRPLAFVFCDLDQLKQVNDSMGHSAGDELIARFATLTHRRLRASDTVGRYAGDEFLVLLPNADEIGAIKVVRSLQDIRELPVASYGIAVLDATVDEAVSVADMIAAADAAMYAAKSEPGRVSVARRHDGTASDGRAVLRPGLANNPFANPPRLADRATS